MLAKRLRILHYERMSNTIERNSQTRFLITLGVLIEDELLCPYCKGEGFEVGTQVHYSAGGHFIEGEEECYIDCPECDGAGVLMRIVED